MRITPHSVVRTVGGGIVLGVQLRVKFNGVEVKSCRACDPETGEAEFFLLERPGRLWFPANRFAAEPTIIKVRGDLELLDTDGNPVEIAPEFPAENFPPIGDRQRRSLMTLGI